MFFVTPKFCKNQMKKFFVKRLNEFIFFISKAPLEQYNWTNFV